MAPRGRGCGRRGIAREGCCHLGGGDGGCWPTNVGLGIGLGGTCRTGRGTLPSGRAEPVFRSYGGSATHGGSH